MKEKITKFFLRLSLVVTTFLLSPFHAKAENIENILSPQLSGDVEPTFVISLFLKQSLPWLAAILLPITIIVVVVIIVARNRKKKTPQTKKKK